MKNTIMALAILLAMPATQLFAQNQKGAELSIGAEGALPIGSFKDSHKYGVGGTAKFAYNFTENLALTAQSGYLTFKGKKFSYADGETSYEGSYASANMIPVRVGGRYTFSGGFYAEPQLGLAILKSGGENSTGFNYAFNVGYHTNPGIDISAKYEAISKDGTASFIGLRLAYSFGL